MLAMKEKSGERNFKKLRNDINVTLPPPLGPTRATFEPGLSFNVIPCSLTDNKNMRSFKFKIEKVLQLCGAFEILQSKWLSFVSQSDYLHVNLFSSSAFLAR